MKNTLILMVLIAMLNFSCQKDDDSNNSGSTDGIQGYQLLTNLTGHWVGNNETAYGTFDWFAFDFRPISASHVHSIYEGGTNQNIITSVFIADFEGKQQVMARNGGWIGGQYRATYFVLDKAEENGNEKYYRLVDAVGKEDRAYMEFRFENGMLEFDAYKDNSGSLDEPIHHMGFEGTNFNPSFAESAIAEFNFPQEISEVNLENKFNNLIDSDSALFLEEDQDPFPKSDHGYISDLKINIERGSGIEDDKLLLYISTESLINENGDVNLDNLNTKVVRTIDVHSSELFYETTYLHPDTYYVTAFSDTDENLLPSSGETANASALIEVTPEAQLEMNIVLNTVIP